MSRQETFSVTEIQRMCEKTEYLDASDIHMNDKILSWDGNIFFYKNKKPTVTGNEYSIPIQIKGKEFKSFPEKSHVSYPVPTKHLDNYLKNGGVIYFVVALEKNGNRLKVFGKILLPVDILKIKNKGNGQKNYSIKLEHISSETELLQLCALFAENRPKQSYLGINSEIPDYGDVSSFVISTLPGIYADPAIAIVKNQKKYFYAKRDGMEIPMIISNLVTSCTGEIEIKIDDVIDGIYSAQRIYMEETTSVLIESVIKITLLEKLKKIKIECRDCSEINFQSVYEVARIIVSFYHANKVVIGNHELQPEEMNVLRIKFSQEFISYYERIVRLGDILNELNISKKIFKTIEVLRAEESIYFLKAALLETRVMELPFTKEESGIYKQLIGSKKILLEYERVPQGGYLIRNFLENGKRIAMFVETAAGEKQAVNRFFALHGDDLGDMIFNEDCLLQELETVSAVEVDQLLLLILDFLKVYDTNHNQDTLMLVEKLYAIVENNLNDTELLSINKYQIIARQRELDSDDKKILTPLKYSNNPVVCCCACILLKQFDEFEIHIEKLSEDQKRELYGWPIAHFLPKEFKRIITE